MPIGPVSYTVIAFPGNRFTGKIAPELEKLIANGVVRILDLVFVAKDEAGDTLSLEFDQLDELAPFADLEGEYGGFVNDEDVAYAATPFLMLSSSSSLNSPDSRPKKLYSVSTSAT